MAIELSPHDLLLCDETKNYIHLLVSRTMRFHDVRDCRVELRRLPVTFEPSRIVCRLSVERAGRPDTIVVAFGASAVQALQEACDRVERRLSSIEATPHADGIECQAA